MSWTVSRNPCRGLSEALLGHLGQLVRVDRVLPTLASVFEKFGLEWNDTRNLLLCT